MDWKKRLLRRPGSTLLWVVLGAVMAAFLTVALSLWQSSGQLADAVDARHTAIAVRTDRAVSSHYIQNGIGWDSAERSFSAEERDWLESLDSVEAVRIHSLSAACSPDFVPLLGLQRERSWRGSGDTRSYSRAIFAVRVADIFRDPSGERRLLLEVEQVVAAHPDFEASYWRMPGSESVYVTAFADLRDGDEAADLEDFFQLGERYLISGDYGPERIGNYWQGETMYNTPWIGIVGSIEGDRVTCYPLVPEKIVGGGESETVSARPEPTGDYAHYGYPVAQALTGDAEELIENDPFWRDYRAALERQIHSLPVLGTDHVESIAAFVQNDARIIEGRSFTAEEYETGARVLLISEAEAQRTGLTVGDSVSLRQYSCIPPISSGLAGAFNSSIDIYRWDGRLNRPSVGDVDPLTELGEEEAFTVVGVYRLTENWPTGSYAFTADTLIMPKKAQIGDAFGEESEDLYGVYLTLELRNGMVDEFRLALAGSPYAGEFYPIEQGFEQVQRDLNGLRFSAARLGWIALGAWGIYLMLVLLMYQAGARYDLGVMRSLGASPGQAAAYLFSSGLITQGLGLVLGASVAALVLRLVQGQILSDALAKVDHSVFSGGVMSEDTLRELVEQSAVSGGKLLGLALAQLAALSLAMGLQARYLAGQRPRKLMGV